MNTNSRTIGQTFRCAAATGALALLVAACGDASRTTSATASGDAPVSGAPLAADEPGAPVTLDYTIAGNPVVGKPVAVDISIATDLDDRPLTLTYRVPESGSLEFPQSQARSVELLPVAGARLRPQQVTVIPQRDGRVFLTVSAAVETDTGAVHKSMAVPLDVERAPPQAAGENDE